MHVSRPPRRYPAVVSALPTGVVTYLFTDIEGSTRLLQELGDGYRAVQDAHTAVLRSAIAGAGGVEIRTEGDAFFAVFRTPADAVRAAVNGQRGLAATEWPHQRPLRVRMGLHTGEGELGGDDYIGIDVNRAARIAAAAHGGQVVVSEATRALVERALPGGVRMRDLGEHRLKDLATAERLYDLVIDGLTSQFPPLRSLDAPRANNLPRALTTFVGREAEVTAVRELVRRYRLVTLTGPGGTGKTRLALRVAAGSLEDFADGVFFVDLSATAEPGLVPSAIAHALGVSERAGVPLMQGLKDHLADSELLLIVDNFEQITAAATLIEKLIRSAERLVVLVTSRVPLHLEGEREFGVTPLRLPDPSRLPDVERLSQFEAVALFIERARAVRHDFVVTNENAPAVAEICVRLDGLPLAIELAAVRVKLLSPQAILSRLGQRLPLLTGGAPDRPDRQRTLRGAIAWSFDLLDDGERALFSQMAVFSGGATVEAVEAVCEAEGGPIGDVFEGITSLVDKSLLLRTEAAGGELRVGMLETVREFAGEQLHKRPDATAIHRRHALHFLEFAQEGEKHFMGDPLWLERCERDHDNLRAALRWAIAGGEVDTGLRIGAALWRFWHLHGHLGEGRRWLGELLGLPGAAGRTESRARALIAAGGLAYWQNDFAMTRLMYEEAVAIYRELGDRAGLMEALFSLAYMPSLDGDFAQARALFHESLDLARELGDLPGMAQAMSALGYMEFMAGEHREAIRQLDQSIALAREIGNNFLVSEGLSGLGDAHRSLGEFDRAGDLYRESLRMMRDAANPTGIAMVLDQISALESDSGRHEAAIRLHGAAAAVKDSVGGGAPAPLVVSPDIKGRAAQVLGTDDAERIWQAGYTLPMDEAIALAMQEPDISGR